MHTKSIMSHSLWSTSVRCFHVIIKMINICVFLVEAYDKFSMASLPPPIRKMLAASMYIHKGSHD